MVKSASLSALSVLPLFCSLLDGAEAGVSIPKSLKCPYDDTLPIECLKSAIPPWVSDNDERYYDPLLLDW